MFHHSPKNRSAADTKQTNEAVSSTQLLNTLLNALDLAHMCMENNAENEAIATELLQKIAEGIATRIGNEQAAEALAQLTSAGAIDENNAAVNAAIAYLLDYFKDAIPSNQSETFGDEDAEDEEKEPPALLSAADNAANTPQKYVKRRIKTTEDAALALYQLIDETFPADFDLAGVFGRAASELGKKDASPTVFVSNPLTHRQLKDKELLELYNAFAQNILGKKPLANTESNIQFIEMALQKIKADVLRHFQAEQEYVQRARKEAEEIERNAPAPPTLDRYNALRQRCGHEPLQNNPINHDIARRELQKISQTIADSITELKYLLNPNTDAITELKDLFDRGLSATTENYRSANSTTEQVLATLASPAAIDEKNTSQEIQIAIETLRLHFETTPAAQFQHTTPAKIDWTEAEIDAALQTTMTQPESASEIAATRGHGSLERKVMLALLESARPLKTPLEHYNSLINTLFPGSPPLTDTNSNSQFAVKALEESISAAKTELQSASPPIPAAQVDAHLADVFLGKNIPNTAAHIAIQNSLRNFLVGSLHQPLARYNALRRHSIFTLDAPIENTVENNAQAIQVLEQITRTIAEQIGEAAAVAALSKLSDLASPYFLSDAELSYSEAVAMDALREHFAIENLIGWQHADRPSIYTRVILALTQADKNVMPAEKIELLSHISRMLAERQKGVAELEANDLFAKAEALKQQHVNTLIAYLQGLTSVSMATLGERIIKQLYALKFGEEEPEIVPQKASTHSPLFDEEDIINPPAQQHKKPQATPPPTEAELAAEKRRARYQRQPLLSMNQPPQRTVTQYGESADAEARREARSSPKRDPSERINLAQELAAAAKKKKKKAPSQRIIEELRRRAERARERVFNKKEAALRKKQEYAEKRREDLKVKAEQREKERQQRLKEQEAAAKLLLAEQKKARKTHLIANMLAYARTERARQQNQPMLSFIQQMRNGDGMPAGYLVRQQGEKLSDLLRDLEKDTSSAVAAITNPTQTITAPVPQQIAEQGEVKPDAPPSRTYVTPPRFATINNAQAMRERMHEYAMQFVMAYYAKNQAMDSITDKMVTAFHKKVSLLINVIQNACSVAGKSVMTEFNTALAQMFTLPRQSDYSLHFDNLYKIQAAVIKQASSYAKSNHTLRLMIKELTDGGIEFSMMRGIATSQACQTMMQDGHAPQKTLAKQLLEKTSAFSQLASFDQGKFQRRIIRILALNRSIKAVTPEENAAQTFLLQLSRLYAEKEAAESTLSQARSAYATASDKQAADNAIRNAEIAANDAEKAMINEFTGFINTISRITNIRQNSPLTAQQISDRTERFAAKFLSNINSSRLERMKYIAMVVLDNLEKIHISAFNNAHPRKSLFAEYREKIWGLSTALSSAAENEATLKQFLNELIQQSGHEIAINVDGYGLIHIEPSSVEDQRLRLLTAATHYIQALDNLGKSLGSESTAEISAIKAAVNENMQAVLTLDLKQESGKEKLSELRSKFEAADIGWQQRIHRLVDAGKTPAISPTVATATSATAPLRSPRSFGLHEEARRRQELILQRQHALASIFKSVQNKPQ